MRTWKIALMLMLFATAAWAQPNLYGLVGAEHRSGMELESDLLLRAGGGVEWPGVFAQDNVNFVGQYTWIGWGTDEIDNFGRWNFGLKVFLDGYWPDALPWVAGGVEHRGAGFIVGQENVTWFAVGVEPAFMAGWVRMGWEASGFGTDIPEEYRWTLDFVPGSSQTEP